MPWFCPTLFRPHRLAALAKTWERCQPRTPLHVRVWKDDPYKVQYFAYKWPKTWRLYESPALYVREAMNEFVFEKCPGGDTYGFIADDILLRTPGGLEHLDALAEPCYHAYPNDCMQRAKLATHFSTGGELVRELGWWGYPGVKHSIDIPLMSIAKSLGLLRYAPFVIFQHMHHLMYPELKDKAYEMLYADGAKQPNTDLYKEDELALAEYNKTQYPEDVKRIFRWLFTLSEDHEEWEAQDRADALTLPIPPDSGPEFSRISQGTH